MLAIPFVLAILPSHVAASTSGTFKSLLIVFLGLSIFTWGNSSVEVKVGLLILLSSEHIIGTCHFIYLSLLSTPMPPPLPCPQATFLSNVPDGYSVICMSS